jgi:TetR/AcrR family transcriptional repressor of nem operon
VTGRPVDEDRGVAADVGPRERLVDAASTLMHERGYEAIGVAELCAAADVRKGSFYHFFDSKRALALEMVDRDWERTRSTLFAAILDDPGSSAVEAIGRYGDALADRLAAGHDGVVRGCRFGNLAVELSTRDEAIRTRVAGVLAEMVEVVAAAIRRDVAAGRLRADVDPETLAADVIAHMEGLMVIAKADRDPDVLRSLGRVARALIR